MGFLIHGLFYSGVYGLVVFVCGFAFRRWKLGWKSFVLVVENFQLVEDSGLRNGACWVLMEGC